MRAGPSPLTAVPRPREDGEQEVMASVPWRDATVGGQDTTGLSLDLPCTEDPELFFAESPQDVEQAKAMCRGCRARLACLAGALERREPWGVWGGELLMGGAIVPRKRARGRPRKARVTIGASACLVTHPADGVGDGGALLGQFQGGSLGLGEDRGLPPGRDQVEAHRGFPGARGVSVGRVPPVAASRQAAGQG